MKYTKDTGNKNNPMRNYFELKFTFLIIIILIAENNGLSQTWSDPIVIYNTGYNRKPDFTVDKLGVIHCVWSHRITDEYRKIYYSKSTDHGNTWTSPADISKNTTKWLDEPHIVADTNDNLHVVYDYDLMDYGQTRICYIKFDGISWSQPVFLADDMPGSSYNRLAVDNNNKIYCFWYRGVVFYRCLENDNWGSINLPYSPPSGEKYFLNKVVVDKQNDLHCIGVHHYDGQTPYDDRVIYFTMTSGHWNDLMEISDNRSWWSHDLNLNSMGLPEFTWGQFRNDTTISQVGTYYSKLTHSGLTDSVMLARDATDQAIAVDGNDKVHIVDNEKISKNKYQLVYYYKENENWNRHVLDSNKQGYIQNVIQPNKSKIYMMLNRLDSVVNGIYPISSILFFTLAIPYSTTEHQKDQSLNVHPNPFSDKLCVEFHSLVGSKQTVSIKNSNGQIIAVYETDNNHSDQTRFYWEGCDESGKLLPSGLYFVSMQSGGQSITRPVVILRK